MAIRIFSKKAFAIGPGAQQGNPEVESFITVPGAFQDMPEKYKNDPTYLLAVKAGDITVVTGSSVEKQMEEDNEQVIDDQAHQTALQAFYEELKVMGKDDAIALGEKYELKPKNGEKMGAFKKRIMEAYKLAHPEEVEDGDKSDDGSTEE